MKKRFLFVVCIFVCCFTILGCACDKEKNINKEEATEVLNSSKIEGNVEIVTTTETNVSGVKTTSVQTDTYYGDKYYHVGDTDGVSTKTWYGYIDNTLYAFYYTKNTTNEETKTSSRIETALLESVKKHPNSVITSLFNDQGQLLENYDLIATKKGDTYTIQISNNGTDESNTYTITIKDKKIIKIVQNNSIGNDSIKTTYDFKYDINDITLPTLEEYPLNVA